MTLDHLESKLSEALDDFCRTVDPREAYYDDASGSAWLAVAASAGRGPAAGPFDENQLAAVRVECRDLALTNEFAVNGHENRINYIVGFGHTYRAAVRKHSEAPASLAAEVQRVLDEFVRENHWQRRQQELVLRLDRDGEVFLRYFVAPGGRTLVRFVEPGQVAAPRDAARDPSLSFGIAVDPDDVETVRAYFIDGAVVDADAIQHRKANVDSNVKRGLPLFYPVRKNLRRAEKLLRNMSTVAEIQSAIALIRKHRGASRSAVRAMIDTDALLPQTPAADRLPATRYVPGTILDAPANVDYDFPAAALDAANYVAVLQAELRAIAARLVMPEFMLTSDASNANLASTLAAESPAVRMFERLQARQTADDREVLRRVVENAVAAGRLDPAALEAVEIQIEAPSPAVRNAKAEAEVRAIEFRHGILSPQTWCLQSGLDYDQEQANWRGHREAGASE